MIYKIFNNGRGAIVSREPETITKTVELEFRNAPAGATAIFTTQQGTSYYRELRNSKCSLDVSRLSGSVQVSLAIMDGRVPRKRWECEGFSCLRQPGGAVFIMPDDANLPEEFVKLREEFDELREKNSVLEKKIEELYDAFEKIKEGYNLV